MTGENVAKRKNKRKCNYQGTTQTLDRCHENKLVTFQTEYDSIEKMEKELKNIDRKIKLQTKPLDKIPTYSAVSNVEQSRFDLTTKQEQIRKQINSIITKEKEIDYLMDTSDILFHYYDSIEKKLSNDNPNVARKIINFFNKSKMDDNENITQTDKLATASGSQDTLNRSQLLENYLSKTDCNYINNDLIIEDEDQCSHCRSRNVNQSAYDGIQFCIECHTSEYILSDTDKPSYKEPPKEISYFSYNRINHLNECINQMQGKETTEIPPEVFDKILLELKKNRITNLAILDFKMVKRILNTINANYYEHIPYIIHRLTGNCPPQLSPELEEKLRMMFRDIQGPFLKHAPANRKNFLSYSYVLHKLLELLGERQYLEYFKLLKSREKLHNQEMIWKKICLELNWEFIPSI
jgi:predicted Zn-ribbon and HTH transcriptional regulator